MCSQRILVIDDDTQILNVLKGFLTHMGYEAIVTDSWEEGIRLFEKEEFSLIILDVHMPGRDGFQVARELKTKNTDQCCKFFGIINVSIIRSYLRYSWKQDTVK